MVKTKRCNVCGKTLPITQFSHNKNRSDGYDYRCKFCNAINTHKHYLLNIDEKRAYQRAYYKRNKDRIAEREARFEQKKMDEAIKAVTGIKAVVLNHPSHSEHKYSITTYGEPTVYEGYETAAEFLKALEAKI